MSEASAGIDKYAATISRLREGEIVGISDLVATLAPPASPGAPPSRAPLPAAITDAQHAALERLPEVFGSVVPTERRALSSDEVALLREERETVDTVAKMAAARKDDIAVTINNHFDCLLEAEGVPEDVQTNKNGHYVVAGRAPAGEGKVWSREVRRGSSSIDPAELKAMAEDPDIPEFTHDDYLAMTEQVRVVEENRFMLHLKKNPHLLPIVARATRSSPSTSSIYLRNAKPGEG